MWRSLVTAPQAFFPTRMAHQAAELRVLVGHACDRRLETMVHEQVALLVLGPHGCTGLAHHSMGRVTARVVRLALCPVVTVQTPTTEVTGT
jgi:nucleotide-binding universal stress UspA family protein